MDGVIRRETFKVDRIPAKYTTNAYASRRRICFSAEHPANMVDSIALHMITLLNDVLKNISKVSCAGNLYGTGKYNHTYTIRMLMFYRYYIARWMPQQISVFA